MPEVITLFVSMHADLIAAVLEVLEPAAYVRNQVHSVLGNGALTIEKGNIVISIALPPTACICWQASKAIQTASSLQELACCALQRR
jgi:hypothetical protein